MIEPEGEEIAGGRWIIKLYNEDLRNLYSSLDKIKINKEKMMCWAEHLARTGR
jgi:hypothetical protein